MPESKANLLASVNEAAGLVQKVFFTYLLVSLYLAILIGSTTHEQMLRESGVQLPLFGVGLSVFWVYAVAPWLYLALHVNLLVQHYLLSRKLHAFNRALETLSAEEEDEWRVRLYPSMFAQMLAGAERRTFKRFVLCSIVFLTLVVAPVVLLLWMQICFLPYHSETVTWGNRLALIVDLVLLWYYWPLMMIGKDVSWRQIVTHERPLLRSSVCAVLSFGVLLVSTVVAVVPGGLAEQMTFAVTADSRPRAVACDAAEAQVTDAEGKTNNDEDASGNPWQSILAGFRKQITRHLNVREAKLLAEEPSPEVVAALVNDNDGAQDEGAAETMRERTIGLPLEGRDLRGANFRHADLTNADLKEADLTGADLGCTKLIGAILSEAELRDTNLRGAVLLGAELLGSKGLEEAGLQNAILHSAKLNDAVLPGAGGLSQTKALRTANLRGARLIGASLDSVKMDGARLSNAKLQAASLQSAKLRGADLQGADLRGANLQGAQLQGAILKGADLRGADLRRASVGGALFANAKLSYADLRGIKDTDEENPDVIEILKVFATHGDVLAEDAVVRLTFADGKPINLTGANGKSVRCGELSLNLLEVKIRCLKEGAIEEYRQDLVKHVLEPLFCDQKEDKKEDEEEGKKEKLSDVEASALLEALLRRASLAEEKPGLLVRVIKTQTESGGATNTKSGDDTRSTASLLAKALHANDDCHGREVLSKDKFDSMLPATDRKQTTK